MVLAACGSPALTSSAAAPSPSVPPGGIAPDTRFTPIVASTMTTPAPVLGTDGKTHLAYELLLTNATGVPVRLDRIDVLDAGNRQALLTLAAADLAANSNLVGGPTGDEGTTDPSAPATSIPASSTAVVWLDVTYTGATPAALVHRIASTIVAPGGGAGKPIEADVAPITTGKKPAVVLGPPVRGGQWYASDGCCADDTHHRRGLAPINGQFLVAQRFAIDWYLLDDQHVTWTGDPSKLTSYRSYEQPAIAAADGVVVDALDGLTETTSLPEPPPIPPIADTIGNHVIVMIEPGVYLMYAHFKTGSVAVHTGDRVKRGDVLGAIGSSGNSTTPHLHFQVMTEPTFFPTDRPPFAFDCFTLDGQVTERIWDDVLGLQPTGKLPFVAAADPSQKHEKQMPLDRNVVTFGCS
ncbi:M23 family metallopeptidase [Pseudonocardia sp. GCM10023141]|uniref:M23 family metallopeptidase n=1 Tax=Pseudonocardia sp. GCM10023141 TaxID=3252653 RepID=UPI00361599F9